jgi:hypothetical protein
MKAFPQILKVCCQLIDAGYVKETDKSSSLFLGFV